MSETSSANLWGVRWFRILVYVALAVAILLISLPYAARYAVTNWLEENGADKASIKDVDINIFTGKMSLEGMDVRYDGRTVIADSDVDIDIAILPLFSRQATVQSAKLSGVHLEVESRPEGGLRIGSVTTGAKTNKPADQAAADEKKRPWWLLVETLQLTDSTVRYISPELTSDIKLKDLVVENLFTGPATSPARIKFDGDVDGAAVSLTAAGTFTPANIKASGQVKISGAGVSRYAGIIKAPVKALQSKLAVDGTYAFSFSEGSVRGANYNGAIELTQTKLETEQLQGDFDKTSWQGRLDFKPGESAAHLVAIDGTLTGEKLILDLPEQQHTGLQLLQLKPSLQLRMQSGMFNMEGDVGIHVEDIGLSLPQQGISHRGGILEASGKLNVAVSRTTGDEKLDWSVQVPKTTLTGNSELEYKNGGLEPPFELKLKLESVTIEDVDTASPDQDIKFAINGGVGEYGKLRATGSARPFAEDLYVNADAKLENYTMAPLSSFTVKGNGYIVQSGELDLGSKTVIQDGAIDSKNHLVFTKFHLKKASGDLAAKTEADLGMPLDKALGMLRDKNDKITLDVPIEGTLSDLDIGYNSIVNIAFKKALKAGAIGYLAYAFQPYGALIYLVEKAGDVAGKVSLDPVLFAPGSGMLTEDHMNYLQKLAKVMGERKQIGVQICSYATVADLPGASENKPVQTGAQGGVATPVSDELRKQALKLAAQRAEEIKKHLVEQHGIDPGRVSVCAPEFDSKAEAKSRVELLI